MTDTERLDWIVESYARLHKLGGYWRVIWAGFGEERASCWHDTPREAIDAAIKESS